MLFLGITTITASLLDIKPYLHLQLVPHITQYRQLWRIPLHPFAFANSTELLLGEILLHNVSRGIERSFGPRKFASFVLVSTVISVLFSLAVILVFHKLGLNSVPAGPYGLIFSLLWQNYRTVPTLYQFHVFGLNLSSNAMTYILASQLFISNPPASILAASSGLLTGHLYRLDTLLSLPLPSHRRRFLRPLKAYRLPLSLHILLSRLFSPLIGQSAPPRRSNRVLPGQTQGTATTTAVNPPTRNLRNLLAGRLRPSARGGGQVPIVPPSPGDAQNIRNRENVIVPGSARAAMGQFVTQMTGPEQRLPSEEEIAA
ncbi:hypothetical protein M231_07462 [Tremella mesenterica]|uniref:Peptidase S54 rhomboid domain-containing protein n=2 Tax=Tremella mesenterica TaxID=5217 RepID=A0A4Q1BFL9_TREME|nr:hypothetical protein M231_07462 [Tremella mesenterica]